MKEVFVNLSGLETVFLACALAGSLLFAIRLVLQFLGGGGEVHTEISTDHTDTDYSDSDVSFKLLTIQGLTAFFMMFGMVGFALLRGSKTNEGLAVAAALAAGLATVWLIGKIFDLIKGLQSSGTIENKNAVGEKGTVYLTIPAGGTGKVQVIVKGRMRVFDAVSDSLEAIKTGSRIKVLDVNDAILVVEKI